MPPRFSVDVDPAHALVRIRLSGFFQPDDIARFRAAHGRAHAALAPGPGAHLTLVDIRAMDIQSQASVTTFGAMLSDRACMARTIAVVVARSLTRLQVRRAAGTRAIACFPDDPAAAERWLLTGVGDPE